ncbi:MAG: Maf family protein [Caulobacteraceae bacterium]
MTRLTLASASQARARMLREAGVDVVIEPSLADEEAAKRKLVKDKASPAKCAEMLAALKALDVSSRVDGLVIGADQTLDLDGELVGKAHSPEEARARLLMLRGRTHHLHSAVVLAKRGQPLWRFTDTATLSMRVFSPAFLEGYLERNGERVLGSVGCYQLEGEGVQLFDRIDGDYFTILGMSLLPLLDELRERGVIPA